MEERKRALFRSGLLLRSMATYCRTPSMMESPINREFSKKASAWSEGVSGFGETAGAVVGTGAEVGAGDGAEVGIGAEDTGAEVGIGAEDGAGCAVCAGLTADPGGVCLAAEVPHPQRLRQRSPASRREIHFLIIKFSFNARRAQNVPDQFNIAEEFCHEISKSRNKRGGIYLRGGELFQPCRIHRQKMREMPFGGRDKRKAGESLDKMRHL